MNTGKMLLLHSLIGAAGMDPMFPMPSYRVRGPKNKYNLTQEQKDVMASMTPKEKKQFLKGLK